MTMSIWENAETPYSSDEPGSISCSQTSLRNMVDLSKVEVLQCCDNSDLKFQELDHCGVSAYLRVACLSCGRLGEVTSWSWGRAIALWNIALWNPRYMGRDPLKLADRIEAIDLEKLTLKDLGSMLEALREVPDRLRGLVAEAEENKIEPFIKGENDDH